MTETTSYYKKVASVTITNGGADYTSAPTVIISGNATATATISGGRVTAIIVTFAGHNYVSPPVITFSGGGGTGASATANMVYIDDAYNGFKQSLSHLIANQLPDFVRSEFPVFITFLEKYYEFLDEDNQVNNFLLNYEKNFDINRTLDAFIPKFKNQYAQNFPLNAQIDDRRLIKFIKQFYEAKGSIKAIELLFKILFNEKTEIFYPSEQILRASDGIWIQDVTLKLAIDSSITENPFDLISKTVRITYYENIASVVFERKVETNISNVTKFAYVFPPIYELVTSLPKNATILVPGAGAVANALVDGGQVKAIVGETNKTFDSDADINVSTNTIDIAAHGYSTGDVVVYDKNVDETFVVTVVNEGAGNVYQINGITKPVLTFSRGGVYTFDQSAASNTNHPLRFKDGDGNLFTTGVVSSGTPGQSGAKTVITVPNNAPDDLRYYCTVHGNFMGNTITVLQISTVVTGLTNYAVFFVIRINSNTFKLASSAGNATLGTAINFTAVGSGKHKLYAPITASGNGYFATPTIQFVTTTGQGASARAVLSDTQEISHVIITNGGSGYTTSPAIVFNTDNIRTKVEIVSGTTTNEYGYIVRQLSTVDVIDCDGTPPCGFTIGDIFQIDESGSVGPYTLAFEDKSLEYFLNKYNESDLGLNPYTLVGRDNRASIRIDAVDNDGCPIAVSIFDTGFDFERQTFTAIIESQLGCTATLQFTTGAVNVKTGRFKDSRGMLSNVNKLQDNFFYQNYSYVVRSNVPSNKWLDIVKNTTHPAGTAIFGELIIEQIVDFSQFIDVPIQPLHIFEFVLEELSAVIFQFEIDFIKVLTDSVTVVEVNDNHVSKVLSDAVAISDVSSLDFTVGINQEGDDETEILDVFDRIVQYVREVSDTTITAENAITDFNKVLQETIALGLYALDYFDEDYVTDELVEIDFHKVIADITNNSDLQNIVVGKNLTDNVPTTDTLTRTVEYFRTFVETTIINEQANIGIETPREDGATASETSTNHLFKQLIDSVTSTDTAGVIPFLVKTDNAGATELLIVSNDSETIDSIAAAEQSLINILKGIFETVAVTETGIVNTQNYVDGDFGSDYVGQVTNFN